MKLFKLISLLFLYLFFTSMIYSQEISGDNLEVRLLIAGQGDPVWSSWGHTGIAIKNLKNGKDVFFDFGNFNFEDEQFFKNFAVGRLLYIAWGQKTDTYIQSVISDNRNLTEYILNLSPENKLIMYEALKTKTLPENRTYLYHHYNDNCSTRRRDYLNDAVNGQLEKAAVYSRGSTFRKSFLKMTSHKKIIGSALSMLQGPEIDNEITIWQEMFLPEVLGEVIIDFIYENENGEIVSLVKSKNILYTAQQRPPLTDVFNPPYVWVIIISLFFSALTIFLNLKAGQGKIKLFALSNIISGLFIGILGSVLLFLVAFTDHSYSFNNLNLFMINPIALFIIPVAIKYWRNGDQWKKRMDILWLIQVSATLVMIVLKLITPVKQDNLLEIILVLPLLIAYTPLIPYLFRKRETTEAAL